MYDASLEKVFPMVPATEGLDFYNNDIKKFQTTEYLHVLNMTSNLSLWT